MTTAPTAPGDTGASWRTPYVLGLALAIGTAAFLVLAAGALGIVGDGGSSDRIFLAVPLVLVVGSLVARLRPRGMAVTAAASGAALLAAAAVSVVAVLADVQGFAGASALDVVMVSAFLAALFGASALLFRRAAARRSSQDLHG